MKLIEQAKALLDRENRTQVDREQAGELLRTAKASLARADWIPALEAAGLLPRTAQRAMQLTTMSAKEREAAAAAELQYQHERRAERSQEVTNLRGQVKRLQARVKELEAALAAARAAPADHAVSAGKRRRPPG